MKNKIFRFGIGCFLFLVGCNGDLIKDNPNPVIDIQTQSSEYTLETTESFSTISQQIFNGKYICDSVVSLEWGKGENQIGYFLDETTNRRSGFYTPIFDENNNLYFANPENNQIVVFENMEYHHTIFIPEEFVLTMGKQKFFWSDISISNNYIFLKYSEYVNGRIVDRVAILNLDGLIEETIDLEPYYPIHSAYYHPITADGFGGIYLNLDPMGIVYFNSTVQPSLFPLGSDWDYGYSMVGWDKNFYNYSIQDDYLRQWEGVEGGINIKKHKPIKYFENITKPTTLNLRIKSFIGADNKGKIFILMSNREKKDFILLIDNDGNFHNLELQNDLGPTSFFINSEGELFGFHFDINPKIIKCALQK